MSRQDMLDVHDTHMLVILQIRSALHTAECYLGNIEFLSANVTQPTCIIVWLL